MKSVDNTSVIVLLGNWNPFILGPHWVAKNIFERDKIEAELFVGPVTVSRFSDESVRIEPRNDKVMVRAKKTTDENLNRIETMARRLVTMLPHTPLTAYGINHAFVETSPTELLANLFHFKDRDYLPSQMPIGSYEIQRSLLAGDYDINFTISKKQESNDIRFDFNFHYKRAPRLDGDVGDILNEGVVLRHYREAKDILESKYGLKLEVSEEQTIER